MLLEYGKKLLLHVCSLNVITFNYLVFMLVLVMMDLGAICQSDILTVLIVVRKSLSMELRKVANSHSWTLEVDFLEPKIQWMNSK